MHGDPRLHRRLRHAARVAERIDMTAAIVEQGTKIAIGAGLVAHRVAVEKLNRHATPSPCS